jgi:hypothetical protein
MYTQFINFKVGSDATTQGAENYLIYGYQPGSFLEAAITNNLFGASRCADNFNRSELANIADSIYHNFPAGSCGTRENFKNWMDDVGGRRTEYAEYMKEQAVMRKLSR